jgi:predicted dehydrogenase
VKRCVDIAQQKKLIFKAGYNHRFHPAISKAKNLLDKGRIGRIMCINGIYGHGGRPGYDREWRMNKNISGGGELIDQGAHLIDLSLWFYGKMPSDKFGVLSTSFWKVKVEDNAFIILKDGQFVANLHASWTEWKNRFMFEIYGQKGYLKINGLGGSYGPESLTYGIRIPGAAPKEKSWQFENKDVSWHKEWQNFKLAIKKSAKLNGSGKEGLGVLKIAKTVYNTQK